MTEHFTREEAVAHIVEAYKFAQFDRQNMAALSPPTFDALHVVLEYLTDLEKQEPVAIVDHIGASYGKGTGQPTVATMHSADTSQLTKGVKLYTHPLPAQPAEPVNAELVEALKRLTKYTFDSTYCGAVKNTACRCSGNCQVFYELEAANAALSRVQASQEKSK